MEFNRLLCAIVFLSYTKNVPQFVYLHCDTNYTLPSHQRYLYPCFHEHRIVCNKLRLYCVLA